MQTTKIVLVTSSYKPKHQSYWHWKRKAWAKWLSGSEFYPLLTLVVSHTPGYYILSLTRISAKSFKMHLIYIYSTYILHILQSRQSYGNTGNHTDGEKKLSAGLYQALSLYRLSMHVLSCWFNSTNFLAIQWKLENDCRVGGYEWYNGCGGLPCSAYLVSAPSMVTVIGNQLY